MVKQISVFLENKKGRLAQVSKTLADNGINIRAMSIADTKDFGILRFIADDPEKAKKILLEADYTVMVKDVLAIAVPDSPGGLAKALEVLYGGAIVIEYMYAFIGKNEGKALVIMKVSDDKKAIELLKDSPVDVIGEKELYSL